MIIFLHECVVIMYMYIVIFGSPGTGTIVEYCSEITVDMMCNSVI